MCSKIQRDRYYKNIWEVNGACISPAQLNHKRHTVLHCWRHSAELSHHERGSAEETRVKPRLVSKKKIVQYSSHRIFEHIHEVLNIVEKITNYIV